MGREKGLGRSRPSWGDGENEGGEGRPVRPGIGGGEHSGGADPIPRRMGLVVSQVNTKVVTSQTKSI